MTRPADRRSALPTPMISATLLDLVRCPACRGTLSVAPAALDCGRCGASYPQWNSDYADLRPRTAFDETTRYVEEALHADARHETVSPPLLSARLRNDVLRAFLQAGSEDRLIDLGCGSGRMLVWNRDLCAVRVGVDVSPYFAHEARREADLALADLRQLPFADGTFTRAYALDVLEHLSPAALDGMLREAARVLAPGGRLFVYTHVRRNSRLALGLRAINALARRLERLGVIDMTQERLRKSDHQNPLEDIPHLHRVVDAAGFRVVRLRYYTPLVGGFVENILVRAGETLMARRARRRASAKAAQADPDAVRAAALRTARTDAKRRIARRGPLFLALTTLTWVMRLDLVLFGRLRNGPFFALLEKRGVAAPHHAARP